MTNSTSAHPVRCKVTVPPGNGISQRRQEIQANATRAKLGVGLGAACALGLGVACKDGISDAFTRVGTFTNRISNLIAVPFSFLFPLLILDNERAALRNESKGKDDLFSRMTYTMASLIFTPLTFGDQLLSATKSKGHMAATLINLPHTLYCLFTYTGGRLLGFGTALKMRANKDPLRKFRLEQEFEGFYTTGNLGSAQASILPMAAQFITGWTNIFSLFKGNFSSIKESFKEEPMSAFLGTFFNSFLWPFEYFAKIFDTTCRTAETVDSIENAFGSDSFLIKGLKSLKGFVHKKVRDKDSGLGKVMKYGRLGAMWYSTIGPPIGMISVVWPVLNKYLRGEIWNKEAQEIGGLTGLIDKVFSSVGFIGHMMYTIPYGLVVRAPQAVTHTAFYGSRLINKLTGKKLDPHEIRNKIFNRWPFTAISKWAEKYLDKIELKLHPDSPVLINDHKTKDGRVIKGTGRCRHIRSRTEVVAQEICALAREKLYKQKVQEEFFDTKLNRVKRAGEKPSDIQWGLELEKNKAFVEQEAEKIFSEYLLNTEMLEKEQVDKVISKYYHGNSLNKTDRFGRERKTIKEEFSLQLAGEIDRCKVPKSKETKIKSKNIGELFTNPKELWEILKLKTFHVTNSFLMCWIKGFVNSSDFGDKGDKDWETDLWTRFYGIRELDIKQACDREFLPVSFYGFESMINGWLFGRSFIRAPFTGESLYNSHEASEPQHSMSA